MIQRNEASISAADLTGSLEYECFVLFVYFVAKKGRTRGQLRMPLKPATGRPGPSNAAIVVAVFTVLCRSIPPGM